MSTRTVHIVGLDISLASTGVAVLGCTPRDEWTLHSYRVPTKPTGDDAQSQLDRMERIGATVAEACARADLVLIEGGAFAARTAHAHTLAGCWWIVFRRVCHCDMPVIVVPPTQVKKYACGRGIGVDKSDMGLAVGRMWPDAEIRGNDAVDAVALASLGADLLDLPVPWARTKYRADVLSTLPRSWED